MLPFTNRRTAGKVLARLVSGSVSDTNLVVLALPRGGVPVAFEVAETLNAPLDVIVVRKLGVRGEEELAFGAIASGGMRVLNQELIAYLGISSELIESVTDEEQQELERRERLYRADRPALEVHGRTVVLVDDGLATGASMLAAARSLRGRARQITVAVPVAATVTCEDFQREVDQVVCAATPDPFISVGQWYEDFAPTTDGEVRDLLAQSARTKNRRNASNSWGNENEPRERADQ
jgi:putative phosphoribosyl transferase